MTTSDSGTSDDFASDIRFGEWLRAQRHRAGLALEVSAKLAELSVRRLKSLEHGHSGRSITQLEASRLAGVYKITVAQVMDRALASAV